MKKLYRIVVLMMLFGISGTYAYTEFPFMTTPAYKCYPRYFFNTVSIFENFKTNILPYIIKYDLDDYLSQQTSNKVNNACEIVATQDSSLIVITSEYRKPVYVIYKGNANFIDPQDFSGFMEMNRIFMYQNDSAKNYWALPTIIDGSHIIFRINTENKKSGFMKGNMFEYDAETGVISEMPKAYYPEYKDSAYVFCWDGMSIIDTSKYVFRNDNLLQSDSGYLYLKTYGYEYSKLMTAGNADSIKNATPTYDLCRYDCKTKEFKVLCPYTAVSRGYTGNTIQAQSLAPDDVVFSAPCLLGGLVPYGMYWISTEYDDYYRKSLDTLNIYDNRTDSVYQFALNSVLKKMRTQIISTRAIPNGTIVLCSSDNELVLIDPNYSIKTDIKTLVDLESYPDMDTCLTQCNYVGDKDGNVYFYYAGHNELFKLNPDGELIEVNLGPYCGKELTHIEYFQTFYTRPRVYEEGEYKYLNISKVVCNGEGMDLYDRSFNYFVLDLNYNPYAAVGGVADRSLLHLGNIYPNPVHNEMRVEVQSYTDLPGAVSSLKLYESSSGKEVMDLTSGLSFNNGNYVVVADVSGLSAGSYILVAGNSQYRVSRMVVIE